MTKKTRIFLMRHGFSEGNKDPDMYGIKGDANIDLDDLGWRQTIAAGTFVKGYIDADGGPSRPEGPRLWVSILERTRQSASGLIHGAKNLFRETPRLAVDLAEQDFGIYSPLHSDKMRHDAMPLVAEFYKKTRKESKFLARMPLGESPADVYRNAKGFIGTLQRDIDAGITDHFCVTHGVTLRAFAMAFMHIAPKMFDQFPNPGNADIFVIEGEKNTGYTFRQIYDGVKMQPVDIDWGKILRAGQAVLPPVPARFR